jgi:hypothetical protein
MKFGLHRLALWERITLFLGAFWAVPILMFALARAMHGVPPATLATYAMLAVLPPVVLYGILRGGLALWRTRKTKDGN